MKKRVVPLLVLAALIFILSGCGEKSLLDKREPVSLSFWHVYGEQAGSPMDLLVQEFNRTVGAERGVQVQVTGMSSASKIGGYLLEAQSGGKDVQEMPDLFTCHIVDALELGEDNLGLEPAVHLRRALQLCRRFSGRRHGGGRKAAGIPHLQVHAAPDVQRQRLCPLFRRHRRQL